MECKASGGIKANDLDKRYLDFYEKIYNEILEDAHGPAEGEVSTSIRLESCTVTRLGNDCNHDETCPICFSFDGLSPSCCTFCHATRTKTYFNYCKMEIFRVELTSDFGLFVGEFGWQKLGPTLSMLPEKLLRRTQDMRKRGKATVFVKSGV